MGNYFSFLTPGARPSQSDNTIVGIGISWPPRLIGPDALERYIAKWYDPTKVGLNKLMLVNRKTGIRTKAILDVWDHPLFCGREPPSMSDVDRIFRDQGVALAVQACQSALHEWGNTAEDITHLVAVTATNAGAPGYDQLVAKQLGIREEAERMLLSGVGCAGGLAALRTAHSIALAANFEQRPARVLIVACEICSIQIRSELEHAKDRIEPCIGPALFGDGAAALVLCNRYARMPLTHSIFELEQTYSALLPDTLAHMSYQTTGLGFLLHLSKEVPYYTGKAMLSAFQKIQKKAQRTLLCQDCDFAVHPGGLAVLKSCQKAMDISDDSMRASYSVYKERGNTSSVAVLAVIDSLRKMGPGKEHVVATSFGPGLTVEMALLRRVV